MYFDEYMNPPDTVVYHEDGDLYYEPYSHTYVRCRPLDFLRARYELNKTYVRKGQRACLNDFFKWLGIESEGIGSSLGWDWFGEPPDTSVEWIDIVDEYLNSDCKLIVYIYEPQLLYPHAAC